MQPIAQSPCDATTRFERQTEESDTPITDSKTIVDVRQKSAGMLDWLDTHWDDPQLRSGFWRSGW